MCSPRTRCCFCLSMFLCLSGFPCNSRVTALCYTLFTVGDVALFLAVFRPPSSNILNILCMDTLGVPVSLL